MTEHVFRAADSDTAMEKAIRELGDDAMILSVKRVGDVTEVRAIKDTGVPRRIRKPVPAPSNNAVQQVDLATAMRQARTRREAPVEPAPINIFLIEGDDEQEPSEGETPPAPTLEPVIHEPLSPAPRGPKAPLVLKKDPARVAEEKPPLVLDEPIMAETPLPKPTAPPQPPKPKLNTKPALVPEPPEQAEKKPVVLRPYEPHAERAEKAAPPPKPAATAKRILSPYVPKSDTRTPATLVTGTAPIAAGGHEELSKYGFPADIVAASASLPSNTNFAAQLGHAATLLAERLTLGPQAPAPLESEIVLVFGPPGSGKTTTTAKIAFHRIQTSQSRPSLFSISKGGLFSDDKLRRHAEFLNTPFVETLAAAKLPLIIDCDRTEAAHINAAITTLQDRFGGARVRPVLTLPGTWSANAIDKIVRDMAQPNLAVIITHTQISGIGIEGLSALCRHGAKVISTMGSASISDGVPIATAPSLAAHMRETVAYPK